MDAIPYDLRRTAVRNLMRGGASPKSAMSISGHKTTDTFLRYEIVNTEDRANALRGAAAYVQTREEGRKVLRFGQRARANGPKNGPK